MIKTLMELLRAGTVTQADMLAPLAPHARGLPALSDAPCNGCRDCVSACPTKAVATDGEGGVTLDRGRCIACGECMAACPTQTIVPDRSARVARRTRQALVVSNRVRAPERTSPVPTPFARSLHVREVSTGDAASDLEVAASNNPIFDASRFGIQVVASPRFADALVVTGPVGLAMQEPLRRCWDAMAEPRVVVAAGASAISGVPHDGGYASANGVDAVLPVDVYVPGWPPHPAYLLHGMLVAMGRVQE